MAILLDPGSTLRRILAFALALSLIAPAPAVWATPEEPQKRPAFVTPDTEEEEEEKKRGPSSRRMGFGFKTGDSFYLQGRPPTTDGGGRPHVRLSREQIAARQKAVTDFLRTRSGPLTKNDVVKIYSLAGDFTVIHGMLGNGITAAQSQQIGHLRGEIQTESANLMARRLKARGGGKLGINDFGSSADPSRINAKGDIDFTPYAQNTGIGGDELVNLHKQSFAEVTGKYGESLDPALMDIVAHRYEATIPDWRQVQSLSDFEMRIRKGSAALRANQEAYFLEGAYVQQVMGRSMDPEARTFSWYDVDDDGRVTTEEVWAGEVKQFFYKPQAQARHAFGASVGNWHFFNSHRGNLAAQAKYVLRSIDDGRGLLLPKGMKVNDYAKIPPDRRQALIDRMYGNQSVEMRRQVRALLDTCANIIQLKNTRQDIDSPAGLRRAYGPLIDLELAQGSKLQLADEALVRLARDRFQRTARAVLVDNMVQSSTARLNDWLAPQVEPTVRYWKGKGKQGAIDLDPQRKLRLQYAAFFELRDAFGVMDADTIRRVKQQNPRFRRDIEILEGVVKKQREILLPPDHLSESETAEWRKRQIVTAEGLYASLKQRLLERMPDSMRRQLELRGQQFDEAWAQGQRFEDWLQTGMFDALLVGAGQPGAANSLMRLRESARVTNERLVSPVWMLRIAKANSMVSVLTVYHQQGEINEQVLREAAWQIFSYVPVLGLGMDLYAGKGTAAWNLVLVRIVPGYAVVMLYVNTMKGLATLAGTVTFAPLERDKMMLAYQGYLEAQDSGLILGGLKTRHDGARPGLMHWVDPQGKLPLDERRKRFFQFFSPRVRAAAESEMPDWHLKENQKEWPKVYGKHLVREIDEYLWNWHRGTGEWAQFDSLALHRAFDEYLWEIDANDEYRQPFPRRLKAQLIDDYVKGQVLAAANTLVSRNEVAAELRKDLSFLAKQSFRLDEEFDALNEDCDTAGHIAYAMAANAAEETPASIRIIVAPRVERQAEDGSSTESRDTDASRPLVSESIQFRAKVVASERSHPTPWTVHWNLRRDGETPREMKGQGEKVQIPLPTEDPTARRASTQATAESAGSVTVDAIATDAEGGEIARASVEVKLEELFGAADPGFVESSDVDEEKDEEEEEQDDEDDEEKLPAEDFLLWIEERGTWCWFRSGTAKDFAKVRAEGIWTQQMAGPFPSREELHKGTAGYRNSAQVLDIPGHGRKHYVKVGGRICFLGVADLPGTDDGTGSTGDGGGIPTNPDEWKIQVTVVDVAGKPVEGAEVELVDSSTEGREVGGGRYEIGPLTLARQRRAPLTVVATTDRMAGGIQRMAHSRVERFYPSSGAVTSVTIQLDFATEDRPEPSVATPSGAAAQPAPRSPPPQPAPAEEIPTDDEEHVWKLDLSQPFEIKAIAPAKTRSTCQPAAEILDEQRMQVTVEQDGRQEALIGPRAMEALRIKGCIQRDGQRCGWIFTGACGYGPDYTRGAPEEEEEEPPMSRHDCIIKYCPHCEGSMLFDEAPDGSPCDRCIRQHSEEIDRCSGGRR